MLQQTTNHERIITEAGDTLALYTATPEKMPLGYTLQSVEVPDIHEKAESYANTHEALKQMNELLEQNPDWDGPSKSLDGSELILDQENIVTETLYGDPSVVAARHWRTHLVPSALALEALALKSSYLPTTDVFIDEATRDIFTNSADAISIRTRGSLMRELIADHSSSIDIKDPQKWVSLACGAARPVLESAERVNAEGGAQIDVTLIDYDQKVLNYSSTLAETLPGTSSHTELQRDLIRTMIAKDTLVDELGEESMDVVDVMGFLEYCRDKQAVAMLRNSYRLTKPGGILMTANMREDRPEKEIHLRGIGWPGVQMRSSDELAILAVNAGIEPVNIEAYQPVDGVYTILRIKKPEAN